MNFYVYTVGCKVNIYESESVINTFVLNGWKLKEENADLYVINTCTVTNNSDSKCRKLIRKLIRENPEAIIVVMGCYSQVNKDEILMIDGVDIIIGNEDKHRVYELVQEFLETQQQIVSVSNILQNKRYLPLDLDMFYEHTRAFLKIQDGCNNFCAFCIIPYARGLMRSKDPSLVIEQVQTLVNKNYLEVVLTGIHTGGYGSDLHDYNFTKLISDILSSVQKLVRLRISSLEFNQVTEELLEIVAREERIAKHFHIPLQSGSDKTLSLMNRKYTIAEFKEKIVRIREMIPNVIITTDLILGHPGESDEAFQETLATLKQLNFYDIHVFPYSKRNGTPAAKMSQITGDVKKARVKEVIELQKLTKKSFEQGFIGYQDKIIIEKHHDGRSGGFTSNYLFVYVEEELPIGKVVDIEIIKYENEKLLAKLC